MKEMLIKMYAMVKETLVLEYGEAFTSMTEEAQASACLKVLNDLVQTNAGLASQLAGQYLADVAQ